MKTPNFATDFSVGFVLFVATIVVIATLFLVGDGQQVFAPQVEYKVTVPHANGLKQGSKVKLNGVDVGSVTRIAFPSDLGASELVITLSILEDYRARIREDSFAWVQTQGLLGDAVLHVRLGTTGKPGLPEGAMIPFKDRSILDTLAGTEIRESTSDLLKMMLSVLGDINRGEGTLGKLLKSPDLYDNLNDFTASMAQTTRQLQGITRDFNEMIEEIRSQKGTLGKLVFSEKYAQEFTQAVTGASRLITELSDITTRIKSGEGTLGKLVADAALYEAGRGALDGVNAASSRLDRLLGEAEGSNSVLARLTTDGTMGQRFESLVGRLDRSSSSLANILAMVERGEGSLGMLVHDPSIAASLRDLFQGVGESGVMLNLVRNAEQSGREAYLLKLDVAQREREEVLRTRALAQLSGAAPEDEVQAVPAAASLKNMNDGEPE